MEQTNPTDEKRILQLLKKAENEDIDLEFALGLAKEAAELSVRIDDINLMSKSRYQLSEVYSKLGETDKSIQFIKETIGLHQVVGDHSLIANSKFKLADIYFRSENYHLSLIYLLDSLDIYNKLDDNYNKARVQKSLGRIYEYFGDERNAIMAYEKSIEAAKKIGNKDLESDAYNPLSGIYLNQNDIKKAEQLIDLSIEMKQASGDTSGLAFAQYGKGKVHVKKKQIHRAADAYNQAIRLHREKGELMGLGMCYYKLGVMYFEAGDSNKAIEALKGALNFAGLYNLRVIKTKCNNFLYRIYKAEDDLKNALHFIETYTEERETLIGAQTQKVIESYDAITTMERLQQEAENQREKAEILKKKDLAEQATKMKQDFLSTMSHEIRTPLNAVTTITSLLQDNQGEDNTSLLNSLNFSANNLLRIINDILDFNKLEVGKLSLQTSVSEFRSLITNIRSAYESLAVEKGIALNLDLDDKISSHYKMDETRITQILGNIVSNAIKFTDKGSVDIKISLVESKGQNDTLRFSVSDTGIGIAKDFLPEVFESFSQPQFHKTKKYGGSGLGLAIVKKLISLHGSRIFVESEERKGAVFYFALDLERAKPVAKKASVQKIKLNSMSILLAEDNRINAMVSMKLLNNWGLSVDLAKDGKEAVKMAKKKPYDCILMDIHMPKMDGFESANAIRFSENFNSEKPIYALTADVIAGQESNFSDLFNGFLLKPIEQEKLFTTLSSIQ
ncbi:MAG: tetratricopeptide repeat protein [Cyclobacteriaceae bacterium]